ncbi:MAG: ribokinase [Chloroflexota bacterium]
MKQIVVVGSANTDMILKCEHLPKPGETILGGEFAIAAGGKGANQAVAAARLGGEVTFVARLGRDWMGDQALANYRAEGINCDFITRDERASSGVALIMVDRAAENLIGVAPGANSTLAPEHIAHAESVIRETGALVVQLEIPLETVAAAIRLARKHAVRVILNPAPARALPSEMLQDVIVTPNETEAAILTGQEVTTQTGIENAARQLLALGAREVVMTLGERGALWATRAQMQIVPAFRVEPVDTTAAGDAFNGGLAVALARGEEMEPAIRFASAVAALSVTRFGAQSSLPSKRAVESFLSENQ